MWDDPCRPYANYTNGEIKQVCAMWAETENSDDDELARRSQLCIRNCRAELKRRRNMNPKQDSAQYMNR